MWPCCQKRSTRLRVNQPTWILPRPKYDSILSLNKSTTYVYFQHMVIEMQKVIEEERKQRIKSEENTERKVNKLKKEIAENRNRYKKDMVENTDRYKKDLVENTDSHKTEMKKLENKVAELENKVAEQKTEIKDERKKRMVLEGDVDELKHSSNVYADWIVAGVCYKIFCC